MKRSWIGLTFLLVIFSTLSFSGCDEFFPSENSVSSVRISPTNLFMKSGVSQQFTATSVTLGGTETDVTKSAGWTSSNTSIVEVDRNGLATAKTRTTLGTATVTASASGKSTSTPVTVESGTLTSISVGSSGTLTVGGTLQLTATGSFDDSSTANITNLVTWSASDPAIATISATGLATGVAAGTVTFTVKANVSNGTSVTSVSGTRDFTLSQF